MRQYFGKDLCYWNNKFLLDIIYFETLSKFYNARIKFKITETKWMMIVNVLVTESHRIRRESLIFLSLKKDFLC